MSESHDAHMGESGRAHAPAGSARVVGLWRGHEVALSAVMRLEKLTLVFEPADSRSLRVPLDSLDGIQFSGVHAMLYSRSGDVLDITLQDDNARAIMRASLDAAFDMPELTRSLRALGAAGGENTSAHDRWFAPLLNARRQLVGVSDPLRQVALFDTDRMQAELDRALIELAVTQTGGDGPRSRGLEAMLEEQTEGVRRALAAVSLSANDLSGGAADTRLADWRRWVSAVRDLYRSADDAWPAIASALRTGP